MRHFYMGNSGYNAFPDLLQEEHLTQNFSLDLQPNIVFLKQVRFRVVLWETRFMENSRC